MILIHFPNGKIWCSRTLSVLSPKTHVLVTISVGGALSTCQLPCLAGTNSKSFQEVRSRSRVQYLFTTPILRTDNRTYLSKQYVSEVRHMLKWWGGWTGPWHHFYYTNVIIVPKSSSKPTS